MALMVIKIMAINKKVSGKIYNKIVRKNTVHINSSMIVRSDMVLVLSAKEDITGCKTIDKIAANASIIPIQVLLIFFDCKKIAAKLFIAHWQIQ